MHRATGQGGIGGRRRHMVLISQFRLQQRCLGGVQVRQHHGHGVVPPGQAAQIGLMAVVVAPHQVHARQHGAHGRAVHGLGGQLALAAQLAHHRCRFARHGVQDFAVLVTTRLGHRDAAVRQVLHQVQVKRQLLGRQALEQREHEFALRAGEEVVGVFNPALNAAQFDQLANLQAAQHFACIFFGDFGKNGHRSAQRGKSRGGGKGASQSQGRPRR